MSAARSATRDLGVILAIVLVPVALFSPVWATGRVFISDGQYAAFFAPLAHWSNAWIGGWAAGADTAAYVWYPLRIVLARSEVGFDAFVVSAYAIAALGTYAYLRLVGVARAGAAFGGVSFALSGFMVAHLVHTSMIHAAAWVPWMFAAVEGCLRRGQRRSAAVAAGAVAMACLAGHMQIAFYGLFTVSAYLVWRAPAVWHEGRAGAWVLAIGGMVLGLLLAAPQLLMTIDYLEETPRALLSYEAFVAYSLPRAQLATLLFPFLFGGNAQPLGTPYFGAENFAELCVYVPFLSLALALAGARFGPRSIARFWAALAVVALLLALGGSLPALAALMYRVPGFNLFRVPARHAMELALALSILAAFGLDWLVRTPRATRWRFAAGVLGLAVLVVLSSVPAHRLAAAAAVAGNVALPPWSADPAMRWGIAGILAALIAVGALASGMRGGFVVVAMCTLFGLTTYAWFADWRLSVTAGPPRPTLIEADIAARLRAGGGRVLHAQGGWGTPFTAGRTRRFGMPSLNWYGPLIPVRALELLQVTANGVVKAQTLANENTVLDVYGVRYVAITSARSEGHVKKRAALATSRWRQVAQEEDTTVYENLRALPLAWLAPAWREVAAEEARRVLQTDGGFDPRREALVRGLPSGTAAASSAGTVDARWVDEGWITADVAAPGGGLLVFSVNDVTGWTATVDGVPRPIVNADYALIGLPVSGGRHRVELRFRVPAWQWAVPWSLALLGFVALAGFGRQVSTPAIDSDEA